MCIEAPVLRLERKRRPAGFPERAVRVVDALCVAKHVQHEISAVCQLEREPVPTDLVRTQLIRAEFMIHPTDSSRLEALDTCVGSQGTSRRCAALRGLVSLRTRA